MARKRITDLPIVTNLSDNDRIMVEMINGATSTTSTASANTLMKYVRDSIGPGARDGYTGSTGFVGSVGNIGFTGSKGFTGSQGTVGFVGSASTIAGPVGLTGFTGSTGIAGFTGSASTIAGFTGSTGFTGSVGIGFTGSASTVAGPIGFSGSQGNVGFVGSSGFTGSASTVAGPIGFSGSQGNVGFVGSSGIAGLTGFTGSAGIAGVAGFTGSQGNVGFVGSASTVSGFTGSQGPAGAGFTGSSGTQGLTGFTGSIGFTGSSGIGFTGSASTVAGPSGTQGLTGFTGSSGITGFTGSASTVAGPSGTQGIAGFTGSQGNLGFVGSAGINGATGPSGFTGSAGINGFTGSLGNVGYTGSASTVAGPTGTSGFTGSAGVAGFTGSASTVAGPAGILGFTGSRGTSGFAGSAGINGFTGSASTVAGPAGFTGSAGTGSGSSYTDGDVNLKPIESIEVRVADETTPLTAGTNKTSFRLPYPFTLTEVLASLNTPQASGSIFTVDINKNNTSILSTKLTIDNTEDDSDTAATQPVLSTTVFARRDKISIDIDQIGNGTAAGLKISLVGYRSNVIASAPVFTLSGPTISNAAPVLVSPPTLSGFAVAGQVLWVDDGSHYPPTTYTRQWVSGTTETPVTPINGETGQSIVVPAIGGQYIGCIVTPANGDTPILSDVFRVHFSTISPPVLLRTSVSGASPFTYTVTYDNTVFSDDIEEVQYASDPSFADNTILWQASRGLTEAAFVTPFLSDDSVDADPAWSTPPPTFTGTYFVRRRVISLDGFVESIWSNTESNVTLDLTVRIDPAASWDSPRGGVGSTSKFTYSGDLLTFTDANGASGDSFRAHVGRVNYARTGRRTIELIINTATTGNGWVGIGFDDGLFDWSGNGTSDDNDRQITANGWKGVLFRATSTDLASYRGNGTTTTSGTTVNAGTGFTGWQAGDIMRVDYTPGTYTDDVPNNNGVCVVSRMRSGVEYVIQTSTGITSMRSQKVIFTANFGRSGTLKLTGLTPAINVASQEYQ